MYDQTAAASRLVARAVTEMRSDEKFDEALIRFMSGVQDLINAYFAREYPKMAPPTITNTVGPKYVRIVKEDAHGTSRSVYCFVERGTGNILKADGWKRPAPGPRGNIYFPNALARCSVYSVS